MGLTDAEVPRQERLNDLFAGLDVALGNRLMQPLANVGVERLSTERGLQYRAIDCIDHGNGFLQSGRDVICVPITSKQSGGYCTVCPPSTSSKVPVTKRAASDNRYSTAEETSSGWPSSLIR